MSNDKISKLIETNSQLIEANNKLNTKVEQSINKESIKWKIFITSLPVILTAILGYWVWRGQVNIQKDIDKSGKTLSTKLELSKYYYEERVELYKAIYDEMVALIDAFQNSKVDNTYKTKAIDGLQKLYQANILGGFWMSNKLRDEIEKVWIIGVSMLIPKKSGASTNIDMLKTRISNVETIMKEELGVEELRQQPWRNSK